MTNLVSSVLMEPEAVQFTVARTTTRDDILDSLAKVADYKVRLAAVENPAVSTETLKSCCEDENELVRQRASEVLQARVS